MTTRIKYIDFKYKENYKISLRALVSKSTGAKYRILLNLSNKDEMQFYIRNERTKTYVFRSGTYTNLNVLKRNARNELARFGVPLTKEIRDRSFGICPKGFSQKEWEEKELKTMLKKDEDN